MAMIYITMGLFLILSDKILNDFPAQYKIIFGIALILYGTFRFCRNYISEKNNKTEKIGNENEN